MHNLLTQIQQSQVLLIMQQNFFYIFPPLIVKETKAKPISFAYCGLCLLTINTRSNKQSTVSNFIKNSDGSTMQTPHWKSSDGSLRRRCLTLKSFFKGKDHLAMCYLSPRPVEVGFLPSINHC